MEEVLACTQFLVDFKVMRFGKTCPAPGELLLKPVAGQKVEIPCAAGWFYYKNYMGCILPSPSHSNKRALCSADAASAMMPGS